MNKKTINKKKQYNFKKKGFSLIEIIITLAILMLGLGAVTTLMVSNIFASKDASSQLIAMGLAEEGIEIVRNFKENQPTFKSDGVARPDGDYCADVTYAFASFNNNTVCNYNLAMSAAGAYYLHRLPPTYIPTKFYRKITLENNATDKNIEVISYVSWSDESAFSDCTIVNKCVSIKSVLYDK